MKTNEELLRKEEEDISRTIALSLEEYHAAQNKNKDKDFEVDDENDELLQEAIRLSILGCNKEENRSDDCNDSYYDLVKKNFDKISYYLCNSHVSTKNEHDVIDNKIFWNDIYKHYKNIYIIIRDYMINLNKRNEKLNEEPNDSTSSREDYDSDDSSDYSNLSSLSCCSLEQIKKTYKNINYTTKDYCKWLRKGNRSKCLNDHVYVNYLLKEMKSFDDSNTVHNLVFGVNNYKYSNKLDIKKWCNHSISFYENKNINFGLRQFLSGPCGLISSIQGYIIIILLFNYKYHFLWENNYFNILKTNNDFLNFTNNNQNYKKNSTDIVNTANLVSSDGKDNVYLNGQSLSNVKGNDISIVTEQKDDNQVKNCSNQQEGERDELKDVLKKGDGTGVSGMISGSIKSGCINGGDKTAEDEYDKEFLQLVHENIKDLKYYSLVESLAYILYQCTEKSYYIIAFLLPECYDFPFYMNKKSSDENIIRDLKKINIYYREFSNIKDVIKFYLEHFIIFSSSTGVISFLYSVILTRGINNIKNDMDDTNHPLIGIYGHCSQELVNLLLTGRACSNVFDNNSVINTFSTNDVDISMYEGSSSPYYMNSANTNTNACTNVGANTNTNACTNTSTNNSNSGNNCMGDSKFSNSIATAPRTSFGKNNIILKGINKRPLIGLLTDFEAFKYCEVGNYYKYPIYPIWVISSSNHYTVLFSLNINNSKCTSEELFLEKLNKIWRKYDKENNKYILSHFIPQFIDDLNLKEEHRHMFDSFVNDLDILLYSEFKSFYLQLKQKDINDLKDSDPPKEKYFYLYDAQETPEKSIHYFLLKEVDHDVSHDNHLKFFNTRWPNNTVEILNKAKKSTKHKYPG
ncbi:deubiquitinating enzyme MINDY [Plasmodium brasilianum]|uniref:Deubiquitinating enzyme MINDY-3/4 conserved domain-containing protein n=3 Tax=Plasmodium (Plasmodium) TaxID=418103 RepID=A0A1D3SMM0_PLAMA|nr:conserved Plasmodium protein, unknown function [Plasmodium malariae]KAI4837195.1 deubiquitinating enzyme MINDY [Plasmodium brasilianum]SCO93079.1 conserved Plasmodium protein, unknown function [Plasmodium malariae]